MVKCSRCVNSLRKHFPLYFCWCSRSPATRCGFWVKPADSEATPREGTHSISRDQCVKPKPRLSNPPPLRLMDAGSGSSVMEAAGCGRAAAGSLLKVAGLRGGQRRSDASSPGPPSCLGCVRGCRALWPWLFFQLRERKCFVIPRWSITVYTTLRKVSCFLWRAI